MMDNERLIAAFEDNLDTFRYPGPVVCETVNVPQADTTQWRLKGFIPAHGYVKRGYIHYKGVQVLRMGVIVQLSPFVGPAKAGKIADECFVARPFDWRALEGKALIHDPRLASEAVAEWTGGSPLGVALVDEAETFGILNNAAAVLPLGRLVRQWMRGAELRMQAVKA